MTPDIRLIAVDMDGTLLDGDGRIPAGFWSLLPRLVERGITFVPASGRQLATLRRGFGPDAGEMTFIAENGAYIVRGGQEIASDEIDFALVCRVVGRVRELRTAGLDVGVVVCGKASAYIERTDAAFRAEADKYYLELREVEDLFDVHDQVLKIAVFDFAAAEERTAPALADFAETHQVVVSGAHWVDIMNRGVNKGVALERVQSALGVTRAQTAAYGDYLNDLEMLDAAEWSFAMENAHEDVAARARFGAPSHLDHGVLTSLEGLLFGE